MKPDPHIGANSPDYNQQTYFGYERHGHHGLHRASTPERVRLRAQVRQRLIESLERQADCFRNQLVPELASHGIHLRKWDDLTASEQEEAGCYFDSEISPALTPLVFDPAHPFPFDGISREVRGIRGRYASSF